MSGPQRDEHKVPVRVNFYSEWGQSVMNLFNFDAEAAETTAFDVKPCFSWEEQRLIQFALNGKGDMCLCSVLKGTSWVDCQVQICMVLESMKQLLLKI